MFNHIPQIYITETCTRTQVRKIRSPLPQTVVKYLMNAFVPNAIKEAILDSLSPRFGEFLARGCTVDKNLPLSAQAVVCFEIEGPSATMLDVDLGGTSNETDREMARNALGLETKGELRRLVQMFRGVNRSVAGGIVSSAFSSSKKPVSLRKLIELMRWTLRPRKVMPKFLARIVGMFQQYCDALSSEEMMKYASEGYTDPPKFVSINVREVWRSLYRLSRSNINVSIVAEHLSVHSDIMACARVARDLAMESIRHALQSERASRTRKDRRKHKVMKERVQMLQLNYQDGSGSLSSINSAESAEMDEEEKDEDVATSTTTLELRSRANQIRTIFPLIARGIDFIKTHCVRRMHLGLNVSTKIVESRGKCTFVFVMFS